MLTETYEWLLYYHKTLRHVIQYLCVTLIKFFFYQTADKTLNGVPLFCSNFSEENMGLFNSYVTHFLLIEKFYAIVINFKIRLRFLLQDGNHDAKFDLKDLLKITFIRR